MRSFVGWSLICPLHQKYTIDPLLNKGSLEVLHLFRWSTHTPTRTRTHTHAHTRYTDRHHTHTHNQNTKRKTHIPAHTHTGTDTHTHTEEDTYTHTHTGNFTSVFDTRPSFRAKGLRANLRNHHFTSTFGHQNV